MKVWSIHHRFGAVCHVYLHDTVLPEISGAWLLQSCRYFIDITLNNIELQSDIQ